MDGYRVLELASSVDVLQGQATWRDDGGDAAEYATPKDLALRCKSAPLCFLSANFQSVHDVGILLTAIVGSALVADLLVLTLAGCYRPT